jgi:hypothetical protein
VGEREREKRRKESKFLLLSEEKVADGGLPSDDGRGKNNGSRSETE